MESAELVFKKLSGVVPFKVLGKYAAYQVHLTLKDLDFLPNKDITIGRQMTEFCKKNPPLFKKLYPLMDKYREMITFMPKKKFGNLRNGFVHLMIHCYF